MSAAPPKSVVFETPPPTYVFQNTFFQATVKLVDGHKHKVTGYERALQVTLRYHDTYDVVSDQSVLVVDTNALSVSASTGTCQLNVMLKKLTAMSDGRAFCLEIRACDGDLESAFSSPIHVVKEKLQVLQQPPDVWFKDEGGREKCMVVVLVLEAAPNTRIEERVVPLQLKLLYESGTPVLNQQILRLFPDMRPNMTRGRVSISFRIDDVSKNHQGQSFVLEIAPEKQETSHMFQDIAPARTAVIAIRSKRNKRKLNGLTPRNGSTSSTPVANSGSMPGPGMQLPGGATGATPRGSLLPHHHHHHHNAMMMNGSMHMMAQSPSPASQRPRHLGMVPTGLPNGLPNGPPNGLPNGTAGQQYVLTPHPRMGPGMMMAPPPPPATQSWSTHIQQPSHAVSTPMASAAPAPGLTVEWKLAGFEIHPDGSPNVSRPIYRCTHCRRLVDVEMMNHGQDLHAPQCVFVPGNAYRTGMDASAMATTPQQQHQSSGGYYANVTPRAAYPTSSRTDTTPRATQSQSQPQSSTPLNAGHEPSPYMPEMAVPSTHHNTNPSMLSTGASPKALAQSLVSSGQRPVLTISPFMNKIVANDAMGGGGDNTSTSSSSSPSDDSRDGNLFASTAFRSQMDLSDLSAPSPTTEEKLMFLSKPLEDKPSPSPGQQPHPSQDSYSLLDTAPTATSPCEPEQPDNQSQSLIVSVGSSSSLYSEMTSMGISVDGCFSKSTGTPTSVLDPGHPMADFSDLSSGLTDEDQVFYILARMYSTPHSGEVGLPAFDQFQRMLGFYSESQNEVQTQVVFHSLHEVGLSDDEQLEITSRFQDELAQGSDAIHSLPKYQHNLVLLREDALMFYWSQSLQCLT